MYHDSGSPERPIPPSVHVSVNNLRAGENLHAGEPVVKKTVPSKTVSAKAVPSKKKPLFIENKVMDYAPYPILLVDKSGYILQSNPVFRSLLQVSAEALYGTFFLQWVAEPDREKTETALFECRTALETRIFEAGCSAKNHALVRMRWLVRWDHVEKRLYCFGEIVGKDLYP